MRAGPRREDLLLRELGGAVDVDRVRVGAGDGVGHVGGAVAVVPLPRLELRVRAQAGLEGGAVGVAPHALAVDGARAGEHEVGGHVAGAGEGVEQLGGADHVDHAVAGALRQRLRRPGLGGEVHDGVGSQVGHHGVEVVGAGHVADAEVDRGRQVGRRLRPGVDLRVQVVEHDPLLGGVRELARERRTDEAGAARDEDATAGLQRGRHGLTLGVAHRNPDATRHAR